MSKNKGKGSKLWRGHTKRIINREINFWNREFVKLETPVRMKMTKPNANSQKNKG